MGPSLSGYLNLPGLSPADIEAFCEMAVRKFHLRPAFVIRKLIQSIIHPREGARIFKAGWHFLRSLFRDQELKQESLPSLTVETPENWRQPIRVPKGRMELLIERQRKKTTPAEQEAAADKD